MFTKQPGQTNTIHQFYIKPESHVESHVDFIIQYNPIQQSDLGYSKLGYSKLEDREDELLPWIADQWCDREIQQREIPAQRPTWKIFKTKGLKTQKLVDEFVLNSEYKSKRKQSKRNQGLLWSNYYVIAQRIVDEMIRTGIYDKKKNCPHKPTKMIKTKKIVQFVCQYIDILV